MSGLAVSRLCCASRRLATLILIAGAAVVIAGQGAVALAGGQEYGYQAQDLVLSVDTRWAGGASGGYYPVRVRVTNTGRARELRFVISEQDRIKNASPPLVERTVQLEQNATQQFTLSMPLINDANVAGLDVYEGGVRLEIPASRLVFSERIRNGPRRPALLVISPDHVGHVGCIPYEEAVDRLLASTLPSGVRGGSFAISDDQVIPPQGLPESWRDYTSLDIVALSLETLEALPPSARTPLIEWTEAGGNLIIYEVGEHPQKSARVARVLDLQNRKGKSEWRAAVPAEYQTLTPPVGRNMPRHPNQLNWDVTPEAFSTLDLLLGSVTVFPGQPYYGSSSDWGWWLNSMRPERWIWTSRWGAVGRAPQSEYMEFRVPGVGGVPVFAFLTLITLFTVAIGPVNYFVLWKKKQLYLLLVTIPVIALATTVSLFTYALVADGLGVKSRVRSFTVLDQGQKRAVSYGRVAVYAGLAPSTGLTFAPDTAILPVRPSEESFANVEVDWTNNQHLERGWLQSRTMLQYLAVAPRSERGRVDVEAHTQNAEQISASNGLPWTMDRLIVKDEFGVLYAQGEIASGATARLDRWDGKGTDSGPFGADALAAFNEEMSLDVTQTYSNLSDVVGSTDPVPVSFHNAFMEKNISRFRTPAEPYEKGGMARRTWLAVLRENPGIELGIRNTKMREGLHVWIGYY